MKERRQFPSDVLNVSDNLQCDSFCLQFLLTVSAALTHYTSSCAPSTLDKSSNITTGAFKYIITNTPSHLKKKKPVGRDEESGPVRAELTSGVAASLVWQRILKLGHNVLWGLTMVALSIWRYWNGQMFNVMP